MNIKVVFFGRRDLNAARMNGDDILSVWVRCGIIS